MAYHVVQLVNRSCKKVLCFLTAHARYGQTDGQTEK